MKKREQMNMFEIMMPTYKIKNPIRLIELFAGIGSQAMALRDLMANFVHWKVIEYDPFAVKAYNAIHATEIKATDIREIHGSDLEITDTIHYDYIVTYSFPCQDLSKAGKKKVWQEVVLLVVGYSGKLSEYLKNARNYLKYYSWKMYPM